MAVRLSPCRDSARVSLALCIASLLFLDAAAIGVNLGQMADNLMPADQILLLVQSTTIKKVKLFTADPLILNAFAGSGIEFMIGIGNDQIVPLAGTAGYAQQWVEANVLAYPKTNITTIGVGNEVLAYASNVANQLLPAVQNVHAALVAAGLDARVKVGTPSSMSVLQGTDPPSNSSFRSWEGSILVPMLPFLAATGSPFMANTYPYFAYVNHPENTSLNFCLFQPNATETRFDNATGLTYTSMWDAQIDGLYTAIAKAGFTNVSIQISETGWPHAGDQFELGPSVTSAKTFNGELVKRIDGNVGTPLRPGVPIDAYIFDLFDENLKPGQGSEKHYGLFFANGTPTYSAGIIPGVDAPLPSASAPIAAPVATSPSATPGTAAPLPSPPVGAFNSSASPLNVSSDISPSPSSSLVSPPNDDSSASNSGPPRPYAPVERLLLPVLSLLVLSPIVRELLVH